MLISDVISYVILHFSADDDFIREAFNNELYQVVVEDLTDKWEDNGEEPTTRVGEYRVSFSDAINNRIELLGRFGITDENALEYVKSKNENPKRFEVNNLISEYVYSKIAEFENDDSIFTDGISIQSFLLKATEQTGDMVGVYIIYNQTKNLYYVGQAKRLYFRVKQHFTGHGNGDVYADYKYGDSFLIRLMTLRESGYDDLDLLEKDMIAKYHAYESGYNKTVGNS